MIRVLYLIDSLKQRFGVTSVVMNYFRNIDPNEVRIDIVCYPDSEESIVNEIKSRGSNIFFMPKLGIKNIASFRRFYKDLFKKEYYDVVHSHFNQIDAIVFPIAKQYGIKHCISHSHNTKYSDYIFRSIRNWAMCLPLKYVADTWGACSILAGKFLYGKSFINSPKALVINNAIDYAKFSYNKSIREKVRTEFGFKDEIVLGNVGSLKIQKNHTFLLDIFNHLIKNTNSSGRYKLLIAGDGPLADELKLKSKKLGICEHIIWAGVRNDVNELLQGMDIFLLPSLYEGLPVIGIEAQASGIPCLFSDTITREVDICNVNFIPITNGPEIWISKIKDVSFNIRQDVSEIFSAKRYNISEEGKRIAEYYKKCSKC